MRHCDCGAEGTRKDGSGWHCEACAAALKRVGRLSEKMIDEQRRIDEEYSAIGSGRWQQREGILCQ